jgi:hypothetical protein
MYWRSLFLAVGNRCIKKSKNVATGEIFVELNDGNLQTGASTGGPKCSYNEITSPNASIISELLVIILAAIDNTLTLPRNDELGMPLQQTLLESLFRNPLYYPHVATT